MECYTPVKDVLTCLWGCTTENVVYIRDLEKNLKTLSQGVEELKSINKDVENDIERAGGLQLKNENEAKVLLKRADEKVKEVEKILVKGAEEIEKRRDRCYTSSLSSYCLGVAVTEEIPQVQQVIGRIKEFKLDFVLPSNTLVEKLDVRRTVGSDSDFEKVWGHIEDRSVGVIGLYGMGGIGKSTFLKRINNQFLQSNHGFDVVIWVELSQNGNLEKVQQAIRSKLNIAEALWVNKDEEGRAALIRRLLETKKFLLLLDDLRKSLDLSKAGVPCLDDAKDGCKVIFTTRCENLFGDMKKICGRVGSMKSLKIECLASKDALQLFRMNLDDDILANQEVLKLANDVAEECRGLPLALINIGGAMARKREPEAWQHALTQLRSYPSQSPCMRKDVFPLLRFNYDNLGETYKKCFLYCSLFPEKHEIHKHELVNLWIGEGFISNFSSTYAPRYHGVDIIEDLENACLLERCDSKDYIKMHDVIRDMASWIICDEGNNEEKVLMQQDPDWIRAMGISRWRKAVMISLWGPRFTDLVTETKFSYCQTLIVRETKLKKLPSGFFQNALQVLDLSHNQYLTELLAEVKNLVSLQHLDLSYTNLILLPIEIKFLKNLKILLLNGMEKLKVLPRGVISCLVSLKIFSKIKSICLNEEGLLNELNLLESLISVGISLKSKSSINYLLDNSQLRRSITHLTIRECSDLPALNIYGMSFLEAFEMRACNSLEELKSINPEFPAIQPSIHFLTRVVLQGCPIKNMTWIAFASRLQTLEIDDCHSIASVIDDELESSTEHLFSNLKHLTLRYLPKLQSICKQAQLFPNLVKIEVRDCPNLRKLPFESNTSGSSLNQICGDESWWVQLQWEKEGLKDTFKSKFVKLQWREEGLKHISSLKFDKLESLNLQNIAASRSSLFYLTHSMYLEMLKLGFLIIFLTFSLDKYYKAEP